MANHFSIPASAGTVVVVDDDAMVLRAVERQLLGRGLRCETTREPARALEMVETLKPSIVVADYCMPSKDGVQVLHEAGDSSPGSVRVLMSAFSDEAVLQRALNLAHAEYFLPKPFTDGQLDDLLEQALRWGNRTRKGETLLAETSAARLQLDAIARAQREVLVSDDSQRAFGVLLDGALKATGSTYGFIGEAHWSLGTPHLRTLSVRHADSDRLRTRHCPAARDGVELRDLDSAYGRALLEAQVVIVDGSAADALRPALPPGRPRIESVMVIPFVDAGLVVGAAMVANRPGGYTTALAQTLEPFSQTCTTLILREASERQHLKTAQELAHARLRLQATFDAALDGQLIVDDEGIVLKANPAMRRMFGFAADELVAKRLDTCLVPRLRQQVTQRIEASVPNAPGAPTRERLIGLHADGSEFPIELSIVPIDDPVRGHSFACTVRDLTGTLRQERRVAAAQADLELANEQLRQQARTDGLTGLCNRRHFDTMLEAELHRARRSGAHVGLLLCDIDFFKEINDQLGHQAGDTYLRRVADALSATFRRSGELVARWGGEEFAILIPNVDPAEFGAHGERVLESVAAARLSRPACPTGDVLTVSLGMAWCDRSVADAESLLRAADEALYEAKGSGRNTAVERKVSASLRPSEPRSSY